MLRGIPIIRLAMPLPLCRVTATDDDSVGLLVGNGADMSQSGYKDEHLEPTDEASRAKIGKLRLRYGSSIETLSCFPMRITSIRSRAGPFPARKPLFQLCRPPGGVTVQTLFE